MAYTGWIDVKMEDADAAIDIPTMREMSAPDHAAYVRDHLLFMDHHDVLRSNLGQYPFATTRTQIDSLIDVLREYQSRMPV